MLRYPGRAQVFGRTIEMKTVIDLKDGLDYPVKLEQAASGKFRVTYGLQIKSDLKYREACLEFGSCVFHSLDSLGKLDCVGGVK